MHGFFNRLRSLYNIDRCDVPWMSDIQWRHFRNDPPRFVLTLDDQASALIWGVVELRQRSSAA